MGYLEGPLGDPSCLWRRHFFFIVAAEKYDSYLAMVPTVLFLKDASEVTAP